MARLTKTFLILVLAAACSTTALGRQNEVPQIFPSTLGKAIDRNARKTAAPFRMMPVRQTPTPAQLPIAESAQLQPTQLQPTQLQPTQLQPTQLQPTQLQPTQLQPTQLQPTQLQPTQLQPTQLPEQVAAQTAIENAPSNPGSAVAQPPQFSPSNIASHNSTVMQGPPPTARFLLNDQTLNQPLNERLEFGTVMMFPAQNVAQPIVAQPIVAQPNVNQPDVNQPNVNPSQEMVGQSLPPQNSLQNLAQPRTQLASSLYPPNRHLKRPMSGIYVAPKSQPPELTEPPPELASSPYPPNRHLMRPVSGIYVAPKSQPPELTEPPPELASSPYPPNRHLKRPVSGIYVAPKSQPPELTEPPPELDSPQPLEFEQPQSVELAPPNPNRFVPPQMSDVPPLPSGTARSNTPGFAAPLSHVLETSVIGPDLLVRDVPDVFEIVVLNTSEQPATSIVIQLAVPEDLTLTELDRKAWLDRVNRTVSWSIDELPGGAKEVIRYSSVSGKPGRHKQSITVGMQNSFQGQTSFESVVIQNDDYENIEHPAFENE